MLSLLCGVSLFLFGMTLMCDGLKSAAGNKLELILFKLSKSPLKAILFGAGVTAVTHSSSATSVMAVGFVNSEIIKLRQAIGIVMGANMGACLTGWILCLSYIDGTNGIAQIFSTTTITAVTALVAIIFKMSAKKSFFKYIADVLFGFVVMMVGMQMMSSSVSPLKQNEAFTGMFTMFSNPLLGILVGALFTLVLQSATAAVGVLQALSVTGGISFASAFPIVMGIAIGAACPVLLSAIGMSKNGKRTALSYLVNDVLGMILCTILFYGVNAVLDFSFVTQAMTPVGISLINTLFRVASTVFLFPFINQIERLLCFLIPTREGDESEIEDFELLDEHFLETPSLAINQSEIVMDRMVKKVRSNLIRSLELLDEYSKERYRKVTKREKLINKYEDKLQAYLVRLPAQELDKEQSHQVSKILYMVGEFERLADQAVNIADVANDLYEQKASFSEEAQKELTTLNDAVKEILEVTIDVFRHENMDMAMQVKTMKKSINTLCDQYKMAHISRIKTGLCNKQSEFVFHELLDEMEHIAVYCSNVTITMIELEMQQSEEE